MLKGVKRISGKKELNAVLELTDTQLKHTHRKQCLSPCDRGFRSLSRLTALEWSNTHTHTIMPHHVEYSCTVGYVSIESKQLVVNLMCISITDL